MRIRLEFPTWASVLKENRNFALRPDRVISIFIVVCIKVVHICAAHTGMIKFETNTNALLMGKFLLNGKCYYLAKNWATDYVSL